MISKKIKFVVIFIIFILSACGANKQAAVTPTPDYSAYVRANMEKYNQCFSQMNAECMSALFAPQGQILLIGQIRAAGPAAVSTYLNQNFSNAHTDSLNAAIDSVVLNGDVGVVVGSYDEKTTDATGQSNEIKQRYVAEWIRQSNGQWLLNRLSLNILP